MEFGDIILGIAAFALWVLVALPTGIVVGMAIHLANYDADITPCRVQC
jgi:hypothetical protein